MVTNNPSNVNKTKTKYSSVVALGKASLVYVKRPRYGLIGV